MFLNQARAFSSEIQRSTGTADSFLETASTKNSAHNFISLNSVSEKLKAHEAQSKAENKDYLDMVEDISARHAYFGALSHPKEGDHSEVLKVKSMLSKIIAQEAAELGLKEQLNQEELAGLENDTYAEVATKSNFYFSIDENKKSKNLKVYDFQAPGNNKRHPHVILPHEGVNIQNYIETRDLNQDKLTEIYAYYSLLIDMHIAQIRPGIQEEVDYLPPHMNVAAPGYAKMLNLNNMFFEHYHRWREPTRAAYTTEIKLEEELRNRPITDHYDHAKGTQWDVEWSEDQKFPHVATRLGFPIFREEPIERIIGFERIPAHPGMQFQPFLQTPPMEPDASLNFEEGEVIYENRRIAEWVKFWKASALVAFGMTPGFYIFELYQGDGYPSLQWMAENWNWFDIPRQFQDGSGSNMEGIRYCDDHDYMNVQYGAKRSIVRPSHTMYVAAIASFIYALDFDYVTKMRYNKDKDLVFVSRPNALFGENEHVYEMHHLEQMVPAPVTAIKNMASLDKNGILTVHDMAEKDNLRFYQDEKYWNMDLKEEFLNETRGLWETTHADKYTGRIFQSQGAVPLDFAMTMGKVDAEMTAAIAKHGKVTPPSNHVEDFYDNIEAKKKDIVSRA